MLFAPELKWSHLWVNDTQLATFIPVTIQEHGFIGL